MITELAVQNIRVFDDDFWEFKLAPLTVLCGVNSCGKSTLLKTLQMLRQTADYRESLGADDGELRFVGSYIDLGGYASLVSHSETARTIGIRVVTESSMSRTAFDALGVVMGHASAAARSGGSGKARVPYALSAEFLFEPAASRKAEQALDVTRSGQLNLDETVRGLLQSATFQLRVRGRVVAKWFVKRERSSGDYLLWVPLAIFRDYRRRLHVQRADPRIRSFKKEQYAVVPTQLMGLIPMRMLIPLRSSEDPAEEQANARSMATTPLPTHLAGPTNVLFRAMQTVYYLGPLRSAARRYYVLDANRDVMDSAGEHMPYVLRDSLGSTVWHIPPCGGEKTESPLGHALNEWLWFLRAGDRPRAPEVDELHVLPTKHVFVELAIKSALGEEEHALADSGVGYSQVLPILVQCLLAQPGSTTSIEQPELHLNPALQVRLATFFARMAECGKQVILETHSEHLVNAIRVLAAEDETDKLARLTGVYFIDAAGPSMRVYDMSIGPDGDVEQWPEGFFGEALTLTGRLLRAQRHRRQASKES